MCSVLRFTQVTMLQIPFRYHFANKALLPEDIYKLKTLLRRIMIVFSNHFIENMHL